jgi:voltage-dependent calcium channel T type alpha-1I
MIALNSLLLALVTPELKAGYERETINLMLQIISIIFIIECVIKVIVMGFYWGNETYLKDSWNILDFTIVMASIINMIISYFSSQDIKFVRAFRALRGLRPLRVVSMNEGIKTIVNSLI